MPISCNCSSFQIGKGFFNFFRFSIFVALKSFLKKILLMSINFKMHSQINSFHLRLRGPGQAMPQYHKTYLTVIAVKWLLWLQKLLATVMELFSRRRWRPNCQTTLVIALDALSLLFCIFINTTSYHLGRYKPSPPSTKELHAIVITICWHLIAPPPPTSVSKPRSSIIINMLIGSRQSVMLITSVENMLWKFDVIKQSPMGTGSLVRSEGQSLNPRVFNPSFLVKISSICELYF